jgi:hypothetical protein
VAKQSIPDYEETVEYYYRKNKVYFVFKNANFWAADAKERKYTQRWYVHNDSIIKEMNDNEVMEFKDSTRTTIAYKLLAAYKTKDFVQAISDKQNNSYFIKKSSASFKKGSFVRISFSLSFSRVIVCTTSSSAW